MPTASNQVTPYYYIHVQNNGGTMLSTIVTINIFDSNGVPISLNYQTMTVDAYATSYVLTNFIIPSWAHYGTATAYVNVYSNWPSQGGVPEGLEQSFQFTITGSTPFTGTPTTNQGADGNFNFTYRLPKNSVIGTDTVYTSSSYLGVSGTKSTTFQVAQIGDLNGDGSVNFSDLTKFVSDYISLLPKPYLYGVSRL